MEIKNETTSSAVRINFVKPKAFDTELSYTKLIFVLKLFMENFILRVVKFYTFIVLYLTNWRIF